jgi:hypothetical protein
MKKSSDVKLDYDEEFDTLEISFGKVSELKAGKEILEGIIAHFDYEGDLKVLDIINFSKRPGLLNNLNKIVNRAEKLKIAA